ncbi:hypothetical protein VTL71DRAFT_10273 [Oculimacula yallundae]|uniref:Secreted protein n=1 Tax=Oculimacula yallundae TaxID=86028 RepID=A0ABR4CV39_9HELO
MLCPCRFLTWLSCLPYHLAQPSPAIDPCIRSKMQKHPYTFDRGRYSIRRAIISTVRPSVGQPCSANQIHSIPAIVHRSFNRSQIINNNPQRIQTERQANRPARYAT